MDKTFKKQIPIDIVRISYIKYFLITEGLKIKRNVIIASKK